MSINVNINNEIKIIKNIFINVEGIKKKIKSVWIKDENGIAKKVYTNVVKKKDGFICIKGNKDLYFSEDGITWEFMSTIGDGKSFSANGIAYGNGRFVCTGTGINYGNNKYNSSYSSTDGISWEIMNTPDNSGYLNSSYSVVYGNGKFVCTSNYDKTFSSDDGIVWNKQLSNVNSNMTFPKSAFAKDKFYGFGNQGCFYLKNNTTWTLVSKLNLKCNFNNITYGNNKFIAVGESYSSGTGTECGGGYSEDGITWKPLTSLYLGNTSSSSTKVYYLGIAYGNGRFVCTGIKGNSYYSIDDGITWRFMSGLKSNGIYTSIAYGNGRFVCTEKEAGKYAIYYSEDGITWKPSNENNSTAYFGVIRYVTF